MQQLAARAAWGCTTFVPGADKITLAGFGASEAGSAIASQFNSSGGTLLSLSDNTKITLVGVTRVDASFFG